MYLEYSKKYFNKKKPSKEGSYYDFFTYYLNYAVGACLSKRIYLLFAASSDPSSFGIYS